MEAAKAGAVLALVAIVGFGILFNYATSERDAILKPSARDLETQWQSQDSSGPGSNRATGPRRQNPSTQWRVTENGRVVTAQQDEVLRRYYERQRNTTVTISGTAAQRREALGTFYARYPHLRQGARPQIGAPRPQDEANYWGGYVEANRDRGAVDELLVQSRVKQDTEDRHWANRGQSRWSPHQRRHIRQLRAQQDNLTANASQYDSRAQRVWEDGYADEVWWYRERALETRREIVGVEAEIQSILSQ
jgi:hypothetical protein